MNHVIKVILFLFITSSNLAYATDVDSKNTVKFLNEIFEDNDVFTKKYTPEFFQKFANHQHPNSTYLGCADSRVHLESIDQTPQNDIFSIRNIGNQMVTSEGSIDYGIEVLKTKYLIIMGHSACGAVTAAIAKKKTNLPTIDKELETIKLSKTELNEAIIENVHNQVSYAMNKYKAKIDDGSLVILGMIYDFRNDFGSGIGEVILVNENGQTDVKKLKALYNKEVTHINFLKN